MRKIDGKLMMQAMPVLALASVAPNAFPAAQMGLASLKSLALIFLLPAAALLFALTLWHYLQGSVRLARAVMLGGGAGAAATLALEAVRYPGFLAGYMPGNLPQLMGVLLLDRFALGPSEVSNIAGFAYHFWNGASFGILFVVAAEVGIARRSILWTTVYGVLIGIGFLASPVVRSLGGGTFGHEFGPFFILTVATAHLAFGAALGFFWKYFDRRYAPATANNAVRIG